MNDKNIARGNALIAEYRNKIGDVCLNYCDGKCCNHGNIVCENLKVLNIMTNNNSKKYIADGTVTHMQGSFHNFNFEKHTCLNFMKDGKCKIYNNVDKPKSCNQYPIYLRYRTIFISSFCPAQQTKFFDPMILELEDLGFKVVIQ